jgi:hypothetical protein
VKPCPRRCEGRSRPLRDLQIEAGDLFTWRLAGGEAADFPASAAGDFTALTRM